MVRVTTPTHKFLFDGLDPSTFKELNIYYAQQGVELLKKTKEDCTFSSIETDETVLYTASVKLTQEETKMFKPKYKCKVQLRALTDGNDALATPEYELDVFDVINDEVLVGETSG